MRNRRLRRRQGVRPASSSRGSAASNTAATTRRASPSTPGRRRRDRARRGQAREPRRGAARSSPLAGTTGHRPHALGHARPPQRGQRAPARRRQRRASSTTGSSRTTSRSGASSRRAASGSRSDTDTEIVAHLVDEALKSGREAPRRGGARRAEAGPRRVRDRRRLRRLARRDRRRARPISPLVIGIGDGEMLCGERHPGAPRAHARRRLPPRRRGRDPHARAAREITTLDGTPRRARAPKRIDWSPTQAEKGGYKHFMLKEIHEQPRAVEDTLRGRVDLAEGGRRRRGDRRHRRSSRKIDHARLLRRLRHELARGDGRALLDRAARAHPGARSRSAARCATASRSSAETDLVVAVSQSGETLDTLAAVKTAQGQGRAHPRRRQRPRQRHPAREPTARSTRTPARRSASRRPSASRRSSWRCSSSRSTSGGAAARSRRPRRTRILDALVAGAAADARRCSRRPRTMQGHRQAAHARARHALPRPRHGLPDRARGGAQAEGDLVHPRRGVRGGRDEARAHRAHRRGDAGRRRRARGTRTTRRRSRTCRR